MEPRLTYDTDGDIGYLALSDDITVDRTVEVLPGILVDLQGDGSVSGVEFIGLENARKWLGALVRAREAFAP